MKTRSIGIAGLAAALLSLAWLLGHSAPAAQNKAPAHAIFVLDTSLSETPELFATYLDEMKQQLEGHAELKSFNVLTFDIAARWVEPKTWIANTPEERARVRKLLEGHLLEGATDLSQALERLARPSFPIEPGTPVAMHVFSDGQVTWGESNLELLLKRYRAQCSYLPRFRCFATEKRPENLELFKTLETLPAQLKVPEVPASQARTDFLEFLKQADEQVKLYSGAQGEFVKSMLKQMKDEDFALPRVTLSDKLPTKDSVSAGYLEQRKDAAQLARLSLLEAERRAEQKDPEGVMRVLSNIIEKNVKNPEALRSVGYRLIDLKQPVHAVHLFARAQRERPNEPHSYRDLARALEDVGKFGLAAVQYEIMQAGTWEGKYTGSLKEVMLEEYAHMMREAIRKKSVSNALIDHFGERLEKVDAKNLQADLRVTIAWNTDNTDVDLHVYEPNGEHCYYGYQKTKNNGELTQDVTQGFGPERYQMIKAVPGEYTVKVHFYSGPRNAVVGETHVNVVVRRFCGTPNEISERRTIILRQRGDTVEVGRHKF